MVPAVKLQPPAATARPFRVQIVSEDTHCLMESTNWKSNGYQNIRGCKEPKWEQKQEFVEPSGFGLSSSQKGFGNGEASPWV